MKLKNSRKGFTLIELLIVVAIIGILAAIAIPNFLQAQVRAKVSRALADMRGIAPAMEWYRIDAGRYPNDPTYLRGGCAPAPDGDCTGSPNFAILPYSPLRALTTPIDYMSSVPIAPFPDNIQVWEYSSDVPMPVYRYFAEDWKAATLYNGPAASCPPYPGGGRFWSLVSAGPDHETSLGEYMIWGEEWVNCLPSWFGFTTPGSLYDPTNGTISNGDIVRVGP